MSVQLSERSAHRYFFRPLPPAKQLPLLVYLPGMEGSGQLLQVQLPYLKSHFDICCLTLAQEERLDWPSLAEAVIAQLRPLRQKASGRSLFLCGESFGACLALQIAAQAPDCFDRLILINPASSFQRLPILNLITPLVGLAPEALYQTVTHILLPLLVEDSRVTVSDRQRLLHSMQRLSVQTAYWRLNLLSQFAVNPSVLKALEQPILLLVSRLDRLLPSLDEGEYLMSLCRDVRRVILPHSGHACLLEKELNLTELLRDQSFLSNFTVSLDLSCKPSGKDD